MHYGQCSHSGPQPLTPAEGGEGEFAIALWLAPPVAGAEAASALCGHR